MMKKINGTKTAGFVLFKNMYEDQLTKLADVYPFHPIDIEEFSRFRISGMDFEVKAFRAFGLGHVSMMKAVSSFHLMEMKSLIIVPEEIDVPLFSCDSIKVMGKHKLYLEQYDTLVKAKPVVTPFEMLMKEYSDLKDIKTKTQWYEDLEIHTATKQGKKQDKERLDQFFDEYFSLYAELCRDGRLCDERLKKEKTYVYVNGLLEHGGPATDTFLKKWGKEKTQEFFKKALFG